MCFLLLFLQWRGWDPSGSRSFPHASPLLGSPEVSSQPERMKCLPIVLPNYYVLNISMTKMPLDFSSNHSAGGPLSPPLIKHFAANHWFKAPKANQREGLHDLWYLSKIILITMMLIITSIHICKISYLNKSIRFYLICIYLEPFKGIIHILN